MKKPRIIALICPKGGVGKTTSSVNIAACLAKEGKKTLLIDMDPHAGSSYHFGIDHKAVETTIADVLTDPDPDLATATHPTSFKNLSIVPATSNLADCETELEGEIGRENLLFCSFGDSIHQFDFVIIDAPPSSSFLTINVLRAAQEILVPFQATYMGINVIKELDKLVQKVRRRLNSSLHILGYFGTMFDKRTLVCERSLVEMREQYGDKVFKTVIPTNTKLAQAPRFQKPIIQYAKKSQGAVAYRKLTQEIMAGMRS